MREDVSQGEPRGQKDHYRDQTSRMRWVLIKGTVWEPIKRRVWGKVLGVVRRRRKF